MHENVFHNVKLCHNDHFSYVLFLQWKRHEFLTILQIDKN